MNAWFLPQSARLFSFLSLFAVLAALAPLVMQGRYKGAVTGAYGFALAVGLALLALAAVALTQQQPGYVVFALLLAGLLLTSIFASLIPVVFAGYRDAERRKIAAANL